MGYSGFSWVSWGFNAIFRVLLGFSRVLVDVYWVSSVCVSFALIFLRFFLAFPVILVPFTSITCGIFCEILFFVRFFFSRMISFLLVFFWWSFRCWVVFFFRFFFRFFSFFFQMRNRMEVQDRATTAAANKTRRQLSGVTLAAFPRFYRVLPKNFNKKKTKNQPSTRWQRVFTGLYWVFVFTGFSGLSVIH